MQKNARVLIVDDEKLLTESLEIILSLNGNITIVGVAHEGYMALDSLRSVETDIALIDLKMPGGMGGIELIRCIKQQYPKMKTLVLTTFYDERDIAEALQNGADGYILKGSGLEMIVASIENIMAGRSIIDEQVMIRLSKYLTKKSNGNLPAIFEKLTKRELEICDMIAKGYSNEQMSKALFISEGTTRNYITSIYEKTGIRSRAKLTAHYIDRQKP